MHICWDVYKVLYEIIDVSSCGWWVMGWFWVN